MFTTHVVIINSPIHPFLPFALQVKKIIGHHSVVTPSPSACAFSFKTFSQQNRKPKKKKLDTPGIEPGTTPMLATNPKGGVDEVLREDYTTKPCARLVVIRGMSGGYIGKYSEGRGGFRLR